jgi:hypothetical protein
MLGFTISLLSDSSPTLSLYRTFALSFHTEQNCAVPVHCHKKQLDALPERRISLLCLYNALPDKTTLYLAKTLQSQSPLCKALQSLCRALRNRSPRSMRYLYFLSLTIPNLTPQNNSIP